MKQNIKVAKELVKLAKSLVALDEQGDGRDFQMQHEEYLKLDKAQEEGKKYILHHKEGGLWRIQACKNFINKSIDIEIRKGNFGGLIKSEKNLSHDGDCWVADKAVVGQQAKVYGNAWIQNNAKVGGNAQVYGEAWVSNNAKVYSEAKVYGKAWIHGYAQIYGNALVYDDANVLGGAKVFEDAQVYGNARVGRQALIHGNAKVDYDVKDEEITR